MNRGSGRLSSVPFNRKLIENVWTEKVQRDTCHLESRRQIVGERAVRGAPEEDPPWGGGLHWEPRGGGFLG